MPDQEPTQKELVNELSGLRRRVKHLEAALTELQQQKKTSQESNFLTNDILESISDGFFSLDRNLTVTYFNQAAEALLGRKSAEVVGRHLFEAFPEAKGSIFEEKYTQALQERRPLAFETYFNLAPYEDWYDVRVYPHPNGLSVFFQITTQRKRSEEALKESEEKYRLLVENANDAIFIVQDEKIKFANAKAAQITGYSSEELLRNPVFELIHPEDRDMVLDRHRRRIKGENPPSTYSFRMMTRAGEILWVQLNVVLITWEGRPATLNFMRDVTLEKSLEAQLLQAQKMEAIGTLAGGIAHDFNNILAAIIGYTELTLGEIQAENPIRHNLEQVLKAGHRARNLVQQILSFSRHSEHELKPVRLGPILKEGLKMLRASLPATIRDPPSN